MNITNVRVYLPPNPAPPLLAFVTITLNHEICIKDIKVVSGDDMIFVSMPSRRKMYKCSNCGYKNFLRARYCNECGMKLPYDNMTNGISRGGLFDDIVFPISSEARKDLEEVILEAYMKECKRDVQVSEVREEDRSNGNEEQNRENRGE